MGWDASTTGNSFTCSVTPLVPRADSYKPVYLCYNPASLHLSVQVREKHACRKSRENIEDLCMWQTGKSPGLCQELDILTHCCICAMELCFAMRGAGLRVKPLPAMAASHVHAGSGLCFAPSHPAPC